MHKETENLLLDQNGSVLTIWLNRPQTRNALSAEMIAELIATFQAVSADESIRVVMLRGKGGIFSAGADLKQFRECLQDDINRQQIVSMNASMGELAAAIRALPQLFIVLIEGAAMAGGLGISCVADLVLTTSDARFSLTEVSIGLPPAQIAPLVIERIGLSEGRRLMLTAQRFNGVEAGRLGFAHFVVADSDELEQKAAEIVGQGLRGAPGAIAKTKQIIAASKSLGGVDQVQFAANAFADCLLSSEAREGIAAFLEKRQPAWFPSNEEDKP